MNELANSLHQHQEFDLAQTYYKKALLCMKRRHKNKYLNQPETSKILINIATVHYLVRNFQEAVKYYQHALEVLYRCEDANPSEIIAERGKVHMSLANLHRHLGDEEEAKDHFQQAISQFEICKDHESHTENRGAFDNIRISDFMLEARHSLNQSMPGLSGAFSYDAKLNLN